MAESHRTRCESNNPSSMDGGSFSWTKCRDSEFWVRTMKPCLTGLKSRRKARFARAENRLLK